jgi:hypothetical protein
MTAPALPDAEQRSQIEEKTKLFVGYGSEWTPFPNRTTEEPRLYESCRVPVTQASAPQK